MFGVATDLIGCTAQVLDRDGKGHDQVTIRALGLRQSSTGYSRWSAVVEYPSGRLSTVSVDGLKIQSTPGARTLARGVGQV